MSDTSHLYPLLFAPIVKEKIWGGEKIAQLGGAVKLSGSAIGERWDISGLEQDDGEVVNGFLAQNTLSELIEVYMADLVGEDIYDKYHTHFPLLIKIIDAADKLSVQVHPNDEVAQNYGLDCGKSEMWYILQADEGAYVYAGFKYKITQEEYLKRVEENSLLEVLNKIEVSQGDIIYIPAGTVHSIGGGCMLLEVQQSADVTYRIYDYERVTADGSRRELHTQKAFESIDFEADKIEKRVASGAYNREEVLVSEKFNVNLFSFFKPYYYVPSGGNFTILSAVEGDVLLQWEDDCGEQQLELAYGQSVLIPAQMEQLMIAPKGVAKLLEVYIP